MAINENIITDIQQTIRFELKKLGRAKTKAEILSESNLLYRSICNDADNFVSPLSEFIDKDEAIELSSYFREYLISYTLGKSQNMALYSFKMVEWFLNSWFFKYGGYEKSKRHAFSTEYVKKDNLTTLFDLILLNPDIPPVQLKCDSTKLYYGFNQIELYPIRNNNHFKIFPDHDSFAIWKYLRDGFAHGGIAQSPYISKRKITINSEGLVKAKNERERKFLKLKEDDEISNPILADFNLFILSNLKFYRDLFKEATIRV
jgi:hypothetical protein